jgi:hypothetical protein
VVSCAGEGDSAASLRSAVLGRRASSAARVGRKQRVEGLAARV